MSPRVPPKPRLKTGTPSPPEEPRPEAEVPAEAPPAPAPPEFFMNYRLAWDRCLKAWPLFLVQCGYLMVTMAVFVAMAFLLLGPVITRLFKDHPGFDFKSIPPDYWRQFLAPGYLTYFIVLAVLAVLWFMILGVLVQGGMMGSVWRYVRGETGFSFKAFLGDMSRFFVPVLSYQLVLMAVMIVPMGVLGAVVALAVPSIKAAGSTGIAMAVAAGLGLLLILIPVMMLATSYLVLGLAHLTAGRHVMESFRRAWDSLRAQGWRWLWLYLLFYIGYTMALMAVSMVLAILKMIPILGIFFSLLDFLFQTAVGVLIAVFLPVLTVTYLHENSLESSDTPRS